MKILYIKINQISKYMKKSQPADLPTGSFLYYERPCNYAPAFVVTSPTTDTGLTIVAEGVI